MRTIPTKSRGGNASSSVGPRGVSAIVRRTSSTQSIEELHANPPQREDGSIRNLASDWQRIHQGSGQPEATALHKGHEKQIGAMRLQLSALSLSSQNYSRSTLARPGKYEDMVDDQHKAPHLKHNAPLPHHSQCLDCPCLQRCNVQGAGACQNEKESGPRPLSQACRMQAPAVQPPQTSGFVRQGLKAQLEGQHSSITSSSNMFSYNKHSIMQHPGNLQARSYDRSHWLDFSPFGATEFYPSSSDTESEQNVSVNSLCGEQPHIQLAPCSSCPYHLCPPYTLMF